MKLFRLRYNDNTCSLWLVLENYTIKEFIKMSELWHIKFKNYQIEYKDL